MFLAYMNSLIKDGVDLSLAGNGGPGCYDFRTNMLTETMVLIPLMIMIMIWSWRKCPQEKSGTMRLSNTRLILAVALSLVIMVQIYYKISSKQLIYLLSPCHVVTMLQVYILLTTNIRCFIQLFR